MTSNRKSMVPSASGDVVRRADYSEPDLSIESLEEVFPEPPTTVRRLASAGIAVVVLFFGTLATWAYYAELSSAAIASGVVTVASNQNTVQHLEGGIVERIFVREGDQVEAGQVLITMRGASTRSEWEILVDRKLSVLTLIDRLSAERLERDEIEFREELHAEKDQAKALEYMQMQRDLFDSRRANWATKQQIVAQRISQYQEQINGLNEQLAAQQEEKRLIEQELEAIVDLYERRLVPQSGLVALQRDAVKNDGAIGQTRALIAETRQKISELQVSLIDMQESRMHEVTEELRAANEEWQTVQDLLPASEDALDRLEVRSPIDGTIVEMQAHTVGGVISPGSPIMQIVPRDDELVVEARINPADIDVVHPGLSAQVRLTALSRRTYPAIDAEVLWVSADGLTDSQTGQNYFLARLSFSQDPSEVLGDTTLNPGMAAEVIVLTERNTTLDYVIEPIQRVLTRALRES